MCILDSLLIGSHFSGQLWAAVPVFKIWSIKVATLTRSLRKRWLWASFFFSCTLLKNQNGTVLLTCSNMFMKDCTCNRENLIKGKTFKSHLVSFGFNYLVSGWWIKEAKFQFSFLGCLLAHHWGSLCYVYLQAGWVPSFCRAECYWCVTNRFQAQAASLLNEGSLRLLCDLF